MHVKPKILFSFNGIIFRTQKAFSDSFPAFRSYAAEVARGEAKNVTELERIINQRKQNHAKQVRQNAKRLKRLELRKGRGNG